MHVQIEIEKKAFGYNFGNSFERGMLAAKFARSGLELYVGKNKPGYDCFILKSEEFMPKARKTYENFYASRAKFLSNLYGFTITNQEVVE